MYKFFLYLTLVFIYFGLAKTLSPSELGIQYLQNEKSFSKVIKKTNVTAILIDTHETGFFMKTYYLKFRVYSGYDNLEDIIVRTSKEFAHKNSKYIGLSLYRKSEEKEEFLPLPPGSLYIGNNEYGEWKVAEDGSLSWKFNKSFKNLPRYFGWGDFVPTMEFYQQLKIKERLNEPFLGLNNEFGSDGSLTRKEFPQYFNEGRYKKVSLKTLLLQYFKENF